ncbi:RNA polymerase sigma factor [Arachidicoccus soli]|uniref:RNA polymerase sigma factor n=1 Tax=Arachidicoccus soli TaxID=2341117 RepID=A0A386HNV5_9BACT|nr:RNA polymerase sigma factor [Arachidicoccus soli]AYD47597.1 RNA polymerase sigma factor [Arachidicoccus soli]
MPSDDHLHYSSKNAHNILLPEEECTLLEEVAQGSVQAYTRLYNLYLPTVHQYIAKFLNFHIPDIEEIAQDIFLKIWKRRESLIAIRSFEKFLYVVSRNTLTDFYRVKKNLKLKQKDDELIELPNYPTDEKLITDEYFALAKEALNLLPEKRRKVFELRTQYDFSLEEIAQETHLSVSGVHQNLQKATSFVQAYLKKHGLEVTKLLVYILLTIH